ncbi:MAG: DUF2326 domain-containing protein [Oscillospiraceae bacterium]
MLTEIKSEVFAEKTVVFHEGLNVILGDSAASNSIGKSTMLMIIDFIFGGDTYIKNNHDAIEKLGDHSFRFAFCFSGEMFYFTRSTNRYKYVSCCDEGYDVITEISLDDYKNLLKERYQLELPFASFREIVSLFSRVWGKHNYDIDKPLQFSGEAAKTAIDRLIKLYNKFSSIKALNDQIDELSERKKVLNSAAKKDFIPSVNKTQYRQASAKIDEITLEIESISSDIAGIKTNCESIVSKEMLELKRKKSLLLEQKNQYNDRLTNVKINLAAKNPALKAQLARLVEFFPTINMDKLTSIDNFHAGISSILKESLKATQSELEAAIEVLDSQISELDSQMDEMIDLKDAPKYTVERLLELAAQKSQYEKAKELFEKKERIEAELLSAKKDFIQIKGSVLADIQSQVNTSMYDENKLIHTDGRRAPDLQLKDTSYDFKVFNDTGTGKAYASLITLDLAIFNTTQLPFLIHDTMLFKNIENTVFENIVSVYAKQKKQIFIAVDEATKFNMSTQKILTAGRVLQLAYDKTLFGINWKVEEDK